jgi:hypothetical protein
MHIVSKLVLAAFALGTVTTGASAAVNFTTPNPFDTNGVGPGESIVWDFDGIQNSNYTYTGGTYTGATPTVVAPPANDTTTFGAAQPSLSSTFAVNSGRFDSLSFYLGSLDNYNTIAFYSGANPTPVMAYTGDLLTVPSPADGNQTAGDTNRRYFFTFGAQDDVTRVVFSSSAPAFEFDSIAAAVSAVPEPTTWAMMIFGFGFIGFMLRNGRRRNTAIAAA